MRMSHIGLVKTWLFGTSSRAYVNANSKKGLKMQYNSKKGSVNLMAIETEARRLRANWVRTLLWGNKAR